MMRCSVDFETHSPVDLRSCGAFVYFEHPQTEVLMAAYRIDAGPVQCWSYDQPPPRDLWAAIEAGAELHAYNAQFESLGFDLLADRRGWPRPRLEQFHDTAAAGAALALPRRLEDLAAALDLPVQKDKEGTRLIKLFSIPRKARASEPPGLYWNEPADHPADFEMFKRYCMRDVETEEAAAKRMVPLSDVEQAAWVLNQRINRRGIRVDRTSALSAIRLADKSKKLLDAEMKTATGGAVTACSQVTRLTEWVQSQGVAMDSLGKAEVVDLLELEDLPPQVRTALLLRQEAAKSSVSKLDTMLDRANADGRCRGTGIYHAASTGREQSTGINFNNLPRPRKVFDETKPNREMLFKAIRTENPDFLRFLYPERTAPYAPEIAPYLMPNSDGELGRPLHLISDALRCFIWSAPGHDLLQADYSGIEGAVAAWVADETWKVDELFAIMADPKRPDLYRLTAASILNTTTDVVTKKHPMRQAIGKTSELACFGRHTLVLTQRGPICIEAVKNTDLLWDGIEWVQHGGVVAKGVRPVVNVDGITVTPDHLIRTGPTWTPARQLALSDTVLHRALATGSENLPSLDTSSARRAGVSTSRLGVPAARSATLPFTTSKPVERHAAVDAAAPKRPDRARTIGATPTSFLMTLIGDAYSIGSQLAYSAATILRAAVTSTTGTGAFVCYGAPTSVPFSPISSRSMGGIGQNWNSIAKKSITAMNLATFGSSRAPRTPTIDASHEKCSSASLTLSPKTDRCEIVYDILNTGPRNRFTVFSRSGALIVHNCGFGGGVMSFVGMARNYNVRLRPLFEPVWANASDELREKAARRFIGVEKRNKEGARTLGREAWVACEIIKVGWRRQNSKIDDAWELLENAVRDAIRNPGTQFTTLGGRITYLVRNGYLWCRLPSGRCLAYAAPKLKDQMWVKVKCDDGTWGDPETMDREEAEKASLRGDVLIQGATSPRITCLGVDKSGKRMVREGLYGGILFENVVQAIARDILQNGMKKAEAAGYPIVFTVYDEIVTEVPRGFGDLQAFEHLICELPSWAAGMPLTAGGWRGKRYRKD